MKSHVARLLIDEVVEGDLPELLRIDSETLDSLSEDLMTRAKNLGIEEFEANLVSSISKRQALSDLTQLARSRSEVEEEVSRLGALAKLTALKSSTSTASITSLVNELTKDYVTDAIDVHFAKEASELKLDRVVLGARPSGKGKVRQKPRLLGATTAVEAMAVLSEGEQTALGLAGLFTEIEFDDSRSAVVFDDPVSSLDHERRKRSARRISKLAKERQVVVFTHDLTFLGELVSAADEYGVELTERTIERTGAGVPGSILTEYPWKAKDSKKRLGELEAELARIKRDQPTLLSVYYEKQTSEWAGKLSETWERLVRSEVASKLVDRGTGEVRPRLFRMIAKITKEDDEDFQQGYGEASEWARRHDKGEEVNYVPPSTDEMQRELERIQAWYKRLVGYAK